MRLVSEPARGNSAKRRLRLWLCAIAIFMMSNWLWAHDPHDVIESIAAAESEGLMYVVRSHSVLLRSDDWGWSWKELVNGLDNRFSFTDIVAEGHQVIASSDGDGVYFSRDAGGSWVKRNNGLKTLRIARLESCENNQTYFAIDREGRVYRWLHEKLIWQEVTAGQYGVSAITCTNAGSLVLLGNDKGELFVSNDLGESWKKKNEILAAGKITTIVIGPQMQVVFVGTETSGIFISRDGGKEFRQSNNGLTDLSIRSIALATRFETNRVVYLSTWQQAVFRSEDAGRSWNQYGEGLSTESQAEDKASFFFSPQFRDIVVVRPSNEREVLFLGGFAGLFRSENSAKSWMQLETEPLGRILGLSVSPGYAGRSVLGVTTHGAGAYTTEDGGKHWKIHNRGLIGKPRVTELVFPPDYGVSGKIFALEEEGDNALRLSAVDGRWKRLWLKPSWEVRLKQKLVNVMTRVGWSNASKLLSKRDRVKAHPKVLQLSPDYERDQTFYIGTRFRGLYKAVNGGRTIEKLDNGPDEIWTLDLSPDFSRDGTMFATARYDGVFKSSDSGHSWNRINQGLDIFHEWAEYPSDPEQRRVEKGHSKYYFLKLAISPDYSRDQTVYLAGGESLYITNSGGEKWEKIETWNKGHIVSLVLSPYFDEDRTIIVSSKGRGVYISRNGGQNFTPFARALEQHQINYIVFSSEYADDKTIYLASAESIFVTRNEGISWEIISRPVRYENDNRAENISYAGKWQVVSAVIYSAGRAHIGEPGASAELWFVGTGVEWITGGDQVKPAQAMIALDDRDIGSAEVHIGSGAYGVTAYSINGLKYGPHRLTITAAADGQGIVIDAFDVVGSPLGN